MTLPYFRSEEKSNIRASVYQSRTHYTAMQDEDTQSMNSEIRNRFLVALKVNLELTKVQTKFLGRIFSFVPLESM